MSIKIAITYEKGGVGKTTTAVNLSAILAEKGYKVLLADLDLQSYATSYFDMYDDKLPCIYEVMCEDNAVKAEDAIRPSRNTHLKNACPKLNRIMTLSYSIIRLMVSVSRKMLLLMRII